MIEWLDTMQSLTGDRGGHGGLQLLVSELVAKEIAGEKVK
jgi:hypothetical protein